MCPQAFGSTGNGANGNGYGGGGAGGGLPIGPVAWTRGGNGASGVVIVEF